MCSIINSILTPIEDIQNTASFETQCHIHCQMMIVIQVSLFVAFLDNSDTSTQSI